MEDWEDANCTKCLFNTDQFLSFHRKISSCLISQKKIMRFYKFSLLFLYS